MRVGKWHGRPAITRKDARATINANRQLPFDLLSALTLRTLRLCGESWSRRAHRRDAGRRDRAEKN